MITEKQIANRITATLAPLQSEITQRNSYIQDRDDLLYGEGLMGRVKWANGADKTLYNWLERVVDIHVSQLMGRGFRIYSSYDKRDLSIGEDLNDPKQVEQDRLINKRLAANADARNNLIQEIIRENGGDELWQQGAQSGSAFGFSVYKSWLGDKNKPWNIEMVENLQHYWAVWSSDNFRERDGDAHVIQITPARAAAKYGRYLRENETFETTPNGYPLGVPEGAAVPQEANDKPMVTVAEYTGLIEGICGRDDGLYECAPGDETRVNVLVVGGCLVRVLTDEDKLPRYYLVPNRRVQRRPYGRADITETCIDINITYLERMSDWITLANKVLFPKYMAKNFDTSTAPRPKPRTVEMLPMDSDQDVKYIDMPTQFGFEYPKLIEELTNNFVRSAGISRVLWDDPQLSSNSNQALLTTMKGMIDTVEKKQRIWEREIVNMLDDALRTLTKHFPAIAKAIDAKDDFNLYIKWPSVLRKEDPTRQQMLLNLFNAGAISVESFMEEQGFEDTGEEIDRIRDDMTDKTRAAILGRRLPMLAEQLIAPAPDPNAKPPVKHTVNWRADMTPEQEANLADELGFQGGRWGASKGPQGNQGLRAQENRDNAGLVTGKGDKIGMPIFKGPDGQVLDAAPTDGVDSKDGTSAPAQIAAPGQNQPGQGVPSMPGSGQPPVSPQGALDQANQNAGA